MAAKKLLKLSRKLLGRIANQRKLKALSVLMVLLAEFTVFQLYQDYIKAIETADYYKKQNLTYKSKYYNLSDNYRSLSEQNPEVNIVKTIDGQKYALQIRPFDQVYRFGSYENGSIKEINTASDFARLGKLMARTGASSTHDFWIDEGSNQFFLIDKRDNHEIFMKRAVELEEIDGTTRTSETMDILATRQVFTYEKSRIYDFFPERSQLLINTTNGDGCGLEGEWWLLKLNGAAESIVKHGGGCNTVDYRFGRRIGDKLIIADFESLETENPTLYDGFGYISKLYAVDIFSKIITALPYNPSEDGYFDLVNMAWFDENGTVVKPELSSSEVLLRREGSSGEDGYYGYNFETEEMHPVGISSN